MSTESKSTNKVYPCFLFLLIFFFYNFYFWIEYINVIFKFLYCNTSFIMIKYRHRLDIPGLGWSSSPIFYLFSKYFLYFLYFFILLTFRLSLTFHFQSSFLLSSINIWWVIINKNNDISFS